VLAIERLGPGARRTAEGCVLAMAAVIVGYILYWTANDVAFSYQIEDRAQGSVAFLLWIPKLAMPLGAGVLLVAILDECVAVLRGQKPGYVLAAEDRAARGDFSAEV
jgi:TRAP-type C4-dicarboxylate transport system permease small subunit